MLSPLAWTVGLREWGDPEGLRLWKELGSALVLGNHWGWERVCEFEEGCVSLGKGV